MTVLSGLFALSWWAYPLIALGLTHLTIAAVTIYLHRHQTHRALDLHPVASHWFRFWLWLTTGMVTREWVAVHQEIIRLRRLAKVRGGEGIDAVSASRLTRWLRLHSWDRGARRPLDLNPALRKDPLFQAVYSMRQELSALWSRSTARGAATADPLLQQLCDWRARAESSGIAALREFARRLPRLV